MSSHGAVWTRNLVKRFERGRRSLRQRLARARVERPQIVAVDRIDLDVEPGEIFGVLGPNGAGKTTTIRMLSTLLLPTSGEARVLGFDVRERAREVRRRIGIVLAGERSVYWKITGRQNLEYFGALYYIPPGRLRQRVDEVLEAVKLTEWADDYVERYSTGMRHRLTLARALLHDPPVLFLDEPTTGLDPQSANDLRDRIRRLREEGKTVILTTHYLAEADQLCDRVAIIDHGRIVALGPPGELKRRVSGEQVVHLRACGGDDREAFVARLSRMAYVGRCQVDADSVEVTLHCPAGTDGMGDLLPVAVQAAQQTGFVIRHMDSLPISLEDVFLSLTGRELRD